MKTKGHNRLVMEKAVEKFKSELNRKRHKTVIALKGGSTKYCRRSAEYTFTLLRFSLVHNCVLLCYGLSRKIAVKQNNFFVS